MKELIDTIIIQIPPREVYEWFLNIQDEYLNWHVDHISCRWLKGEPFEVGSILYAEEYLHGKQHNLTFETTRVIPAELIEYRNTFPNSVVIPFGSFQFEQVEGGCKFTATLQVRFFRIINLFFSKRVDQLIRHMEQEGENLKLLLEQ